jgi:hypothetical protein
MDLILTWPGILGIVFHLSVFIYFARALPLGALCLPSLTALTSLFYFYIMPVSALLAGVDTFFGMTLHSLDDIHWVSILYMLGVAAASFVNISALSIPPTSKDDIETPIDKLYLSLWGIAFLGLFILMALGQLNLTSGDDYEVNYQVSNLAFLNLSFSMTLPLTLIFLMHDRFRYKSILLLLVVLYIYSIAAFRFRILILLCGASICFAVTHKFKVRSWMAPLGGTVIVILMNLIGMIRRYGGGLNLENADNKSFGEILANFGGELGIVFVAQYTAENPFNPTIYFEPWLVALARFVPTFLWPDKPAASYLADFSNGFLQSAAASKAGMAAPQQVEMIYQFGWYGVPVIAFVYFSIASGLMRPIGRITREARIAGFALIPPFFGYYMQSRGYFFQMAAEAMFTFAPLFILHIGRRHPFSKLRLQFQRDHALTQYYASKGSDPLTLHQRGSQANFESIPQAHTGPSGRDTPPI